MSQPLTLSLETRRQWTKLAATFERARRVFTDGATNTAALVDVDSRLMLLSAQLKAMRVLARGEIATASVRARSDRRVG